MKGISTIIATIILVVITISLTGTAYLFFSGTLGSYTSGIISLIDAGGYMVTIQNSGTGPINANSIRILVNGEDAEIANPQTIGPSEIKILKFVPINFSTELISARVLIVGPSNSLSYTTSMIPHESNVISETVDLSHFNSVNASNYVLDESGYHNDGLLINMNPATDLVNGRFGLALDFDGIDDYVNITDSSSLDITDAITIEAWIYPASWPSPSPRIVSKEYSTYARPYALELVNSSRTVSFCLNTTITYPNEVCTNAPTNSIGSNKWSHVAGTWNGSTVKIYVNGQLMNSRNQNGTMNVTKNNVLIGNNPSKNRQFNGTIDEVKIWNKALSVDEIRNEYELVTTTTTITSTTTSTTSRVTSTSTSTTSSTTSTSTSTTIVSTTVPSRVELTCSGSTSHYCSTTYKSISSIESLSIPDTAKCGDTATITVYWIGRHNYNDNHWGLFLETVTSVPSTYLYYLGSCKSYVADSGTNSYRMSCSVKIPVAGSISNGNYNFWVIGEDYNGYCNPGELGIDAQKYKVITLSNC